MKKTIKDILMEGTGMFSKEFHTRLKNKQLKVNGEPITENIELDIEMISFNDILKIKIENLGDFIFREICSNEQWKNKCRFIPIEDMINSNIKNDLIEFLDNFIIIRISKKDVFIVKKFDN